MTVRTPPAVGAPTPVRFPPVVREALDNGLSVWVIEQHAAPIVTVVLMVDGGTAVDPPGRPGLAGVTVDLLDEGAGTRDAIELADALARLGTHLSAEIAPDVASISMSSLARVLPDTLSVLAEIVRRPRLDAEGFSRVVEMRKHRLQQLSRLPATMADRTLLRAIFGDHPYGHGALGTRESLGGMTLDEVREFWSAVFVPARTTLIVAGAVDPVDVWQDVGRVFGDWVSSAGAPAPTPRAEYRARPEVLFVDRPGAPQAELRIGHGGPSRLVEEYHPLLVLDTLLGGQFSSRINRNLRETRGLTYGARTAFGFRRAGGSFVCETSVQGERTAEAASEVLREFAAIRTADEVPAGELDRARAALSRGYVRNFETAGQLARAAAQLAAYGLDDRTFDRFVPVIEAVTSQDVVAAARRFVHPDEAVVVVVGDRAHCVEPLAALGRPVVEVSAEF